jgi:hypothetical protein
MMMRCSLSPVHKQKAMTLIGHLATGNDVLSSVAGMVAGTSINKYKVENSWLLIKLLHVAMLLTKRRNAALIWRCAGTFSIADIDSDIQCSWLENETRCPRVYPSPVKPVNHYPNYENTLLHNTTEPSTTPQTKLNRGLQNRKKQTTKNKDSSKANDFTPHAYADNKNESWS